MPVWLYNVQVVVVQAPTLKKEKIDMAKQEKVLIVEEGYEGKYVALRSAVDRRVIASGDKPEAVMEKARRGGCNDPVIFYVPEHTISLVYRHAY